MIDDRERFERASLRFEPPQGGLERLLRRRDRRRRNQRIASAVMALIIAVAATGTLIGGIQVRADRAGNSNTDADNRERPEAGVDRPPRRSNAGTARRLGKSANGSHGAPASPAGHRCRRRLRGDPGWNGLRVPRAMRVGLPSTLDCRRGEPDHLRSYGRERDGVRRHRRRRAVRVSDGLRFCWQGVRARMERSPRGTADVLTRCSERRGLRRRRQRVCRRVSGRLRHGRRDLRSRLDGTADFDSPGFRLLCEKRASPDRRRWGRLCRRLFAHQAYGPRRNNGKAALVRRRCELRRRGHCSPLYSHRRRWIGVSVRERRPPRVSRPVSHRRPIVSARVDRYRGPFSLLWVAGRRRRKGICRPGIRFHAGGPDWRPRGVGRAMRHRRCDVPARVGERQRPREQDPPSRRRKRIHLLGVGAWRSDQGVPPVLRRNRDVLRADLDHGRKPVRTRPWGAGWSSLGPSRGPCTRSRQDARPRANRSGPLDPLVRKSHHRPSTGRRSSSSRTTGRCEPSAPVRYRRLSDTQPPSRTLGSRCLGARCWSDGIRAPSAPQGQSL